MKHFKNLIYCGGAIKVSILLPISFKIANHGDYKY